MTESLPPIEVRTPVSVEAEALHTEARALMGECTGDATPLGMFCQKVYQWVHAQPDPERSAEAAIFGTALIASAAAYFMVEPLGGLDNEQHAIARMLFLKYFGQVKTPFRVMELNRLLEPGYSEMFLLSQEEARALRQEASRRMLSYAKDAKPDGYAWLKQIAEGWIPYGLRTVGSPIAA